MTMPVVSVCLMTFNHERYIHDCVMSVVMQSEDVALEILIGDDQSVDATSQIVEVLASRYPSIIKYYRRSARLGGAENYQALLREAKGKYIASLDGDDFWLPGKLIAQTKFLDTNIDCTAVYSNAIVVSDDRELLGVFNNRQPAKHDIDSLLRRGNFLHTSSLLYRASMRDMLLKMPLPHIDYKVHLHLAMHGSIGYLNQALSAYRFGSTSSAIVHASDTIREWYWQTLLDIPRGKVNPETLAQGMADFLRRVIFRAVRVGSLGLAIVWTKRVLDKSPLGPLRTLWLVSCNLMATSASEILGWVGAWLSRNKLRVFYRR